MFPDDRKYTRTHEWCRFEGDDVLVLGLTEAFLKDLGPLLYVELPEVGDDVLNDVPLGEFEGTDKVVAVFSPADGEVVAVNDRVLDDPDLLRASPYEEGWLVKIRLLEPIAPGHLMSAQEYAGFLQERR